MASRPLRAVSATGCLLALFAFAFYVPLAHFGAPHAIGPEHVRSWAVDDETPLGPLAEMHNIIEPKADRNLGYPLGFSFLCAAAYTPYFAYLWATDQLGAVSGAYPYGFADPVAALFALTWIAHALSALLAALAVGATAEATRSLASARAAVVAGLVVAFSLPVVYYARTGNVDVPLLAFVALGIAAFARIAAFGVDVSRAAWLGAFVGMAVGTKEQAAASFLFVPPALLVLHLRATPGVGWREALREREWWRAPLACVAATIVVFGLASGLFVDPDRYFAHLAFGGERLDALLRGEIAFAKLYPFTVAGNLEYARVFAGHAAATFSGSGVVLALLGIAVAARRRSPILWLSLPAASYLLVLSVGARTLQLRYLMPLIPCIAIFVGYAVDRVLRSERPVVRGIGGLLAVATIGVLGLRAVDLSHAMAFDSRYAAADWLAPRLVAGDRIAYFGVTEKLPALPQGVVAEHLTPYLGGYAQPRLDAEAIAEMESKLHREAPEFVILVPDYTSPPGVSYSRSCPAEFHRGLVEGRYGYELEAVFETERLLPWVARPALDYPTVNPPVQIFARSGMGS